MLSWDFPPPLLRTALTMSKWTSGCLCLEKEQKNSDTPSCDETQNIDTKTLKTSISELFQILNKRIFLISFNRQHRLLWK